MSQPFYGQIEMFGFSYAPRDWAFCNGALLSVAQNTTLFSLLSSYYGGDARTTFGLPNLTSRVGVGFNMGNAGNLIRFPLGTRQGEQSHTPATAEHDGKYSLISLSLA